MNRDKFMEAIFASFPDIVVSRHRPVGVVLAALLAGVVALVIQKDMDTLSTLRLVVLFASLALVATCTVIFLVRIFGREVPYYVPGKCFLKYETLAFGGESRDAVLKALGNGSNEELRNIQQAGASVITVAMYATADHVFSAAMAFAYQDLEYRPLTDAVKLS